MFEPYEAINAIPQGVTIDVVLFILSKKFPLWFVARPNQIQPVYARRPEISNTASVCR